MIRAAAVQRGRTGPIQRFSKSREPDPVVERLLLDVLDPTIHPSRLLQLMFDRTRVMQFACLFGGGVGFLTCPSVVPSDLDDPVVVASLSDEIGQAIPVSLNLSDFLSRFTSLVRGEDATALSLFKHPTSPDRIDPVPPEALHTRTALQPTLERLEFPMPDDPQPGDRPVIVVLPSVIPLPPGVTFEPVPILEDFVVNDDTYAPLRVWVNAVKYCRAKNTGLSVTAGGPLFLPDGLLVGDDKTDPFEGLDISNRPFGGLAMIPPLTPTFGEVTTTIRQVSEDVWERLGLSIPGPAPATAAQPVGGVPGWTPEHLKAVIEPVVNKDKKFRLADRTAARYRVFLAAPGDPAGPSPTVVILPNLKKEFVTYLEESTGAAAADDLKEIVRNRTLAVARSLLASDRDVTFEADLITLAWSDRIRSFSWLAERFTFIQKKGFQDRLGLVHFLTPDRSGLSTLVEGDSQAKTITLANSSDSTAQLDASKASKMYTSGRCSTFRDVIEAVTNLRHFFTNLVDNVDDCILIKCLTEYTDLLASKEGRFFFEANGKSPRLAHHVWQDLQLILTNFVEIAMNSQLYKAALAGNAISSTNYEVATAVARTCLTDLRVAINGNNMGKFAGIPHATQWLSGSNARTGHGDHGEDAGGSSSKRARITPADTDEIERKKGLGLLIFDPKVAGSKRLPTLEVYGKRRGARNPERLCMKFLLRGSHCPNPSCKFPHITNVDVLDSVEREKLLDVVQKTPGLDWAPGKAPPGTK